MPPDIPVSSRSPSSRRSCGRTVATLIALFIAAGLLLILPTGFIGPVFVLGGGLLFMVFAFHWFLWGRLLQQELQDGEASGDESSQPRGE